MTRNRRRRRPAKCVVCDRRHRGDCRPDDLARFERDERRRERRQNRERKPTYGQRLAVGFAMLGDDWE